MRSGSQYGDGCTEPRMCRTLRRNHEQNPQRGLHALETDVHSYSVWTSSALATVGHCTRAHATHSLSRTALISELRKAVVTAVFLWTGLQGFALTFPGSLTGQLGNGPEMVSTHSRLRHGRTALGRPPWDDRPNMAIRSMDPTPWATCGR